MGRVSDAKDRLLDAAITLVWRHSYGAVSVEDICNEAGVKKGDIKKAQEGRGVPASLKARRVATASPPPADSPASAIWRASMPCASSPS